MADSFLKKMEKLEAAEDFFKLLEIPYDIKVLRVYRLHILQRFHDYISAGSRDVGTQTEEQLKQYYGSLLEKAYRDFVHSTAQEEKVFKVFKEQQPASPRTEVRFVSLDSLIGGSKLKSKTL
ncbi:nitrogenase-stabilizing/protective protein NifW [Candidatus Methylacidiphilum infernorum]|uniref:Nitrogenase-stabilizing/protective protein NifW n=1 Tax=Methylacidiphilum infernorum (isolate V4) TaxID=481448 RepID=NIFW_METI4|nr:nitrogenase-stabilizing/protective protein NifW [Candidatus Methylacidiphilum infernorum]B3DZB3.1 RecName: Full=Nitrogenase-stabilizing/protective protein NifW [Methylacidiphilum infernorum V4]ACD82530.1 Nitrogen fixation protein NifW [Methylacidiphilum infernorum V4]